jgi:hypothetical protein
LPSARLCCRRRQHQPGAVQPEHDQHDIGQRAGGRERRAPAERDGQRHQQRRRQRPAQAAGDAVEAVGMAQARRADLAIEQRVVDRMEHAVADAGQDRAAGHRPVAGAQREAERRQPEQRQPAEQDGPRPHAVDQEAGGGLHAARDDEEQRHQEAQLGVAGVERVLQPGKQRRQQQLAEVADHVGQADQPDHARILAQGDGQRRVGGGGGAHGVIVAAPAGAGIVLVAGWSGNWLDLNQAQARGRA